MMRHAPSLAFVLSLLVAGGGDVGAGDPPPLLGVETLSVSHDPGYDLVERFAGRVVSRRSSELGFERGARVVLGGRFWPPLATAIAGGVGGSAILSLYLVPSLFIWIARRERRRAAAAGTVPA